jgi:microcystin-dependent protein
VTRLPILAAVALSLQIGASHAQDPFLGEIRIFASSFCPKGHGDALGQLLPINQNQALFSLLGTTYGGDGRVNFALPTAKPIFTVDGLALRQCVALIGIYPSQN